MLDGSLIPRFGRARRDPSLAVLEGLHALKHALRFGAQILDVVCRDSEQLDRLAAELAPDVRPQMLALARPVDSEVFTKLAPLAPATGVIALAARPELDLGDLLAQAASAPVVLLEDPRDLGNIGACIRVAAAAAAGGLLSSGGHDPWHPDALRGSAGLHFALPVIHIEGIADTAGTDRPLLAVDPEGEPLAPERVPPRALLAFGGERYGLSEEITRRAVSRVSIPMRAGVSSLNLATSVAVVLFALGLGRGGRRGPGGCDSSAP
jgi:TrmH family RNA methyltransferase